MFEGLNYIELSGEKYPIKCDMLVLEKIQNQYENLSNFENSLTGFNPSKEKDGSVKRNKEGMIMGIYGLPNIAVVNKALVWMVSEGIEIEAEKKGEKASIPNEKALLRKVDMSPAELGRKLHEEFSRCFEQKNAETT